MPLESAPQKNTGEILIERNGNTTKITKGGSTLHILYNLHYGMASPDTLPNGIDAVIPEIMADRWIQHPNTSLNGIMQEPAYESIWEEASKRKIPIFLASPYLRDSGASKTKAIAEICEAALAGACAGTPISKKCRDRLHAILHPQRLITKQEDNIQDVNDPSPGEENMPVSRRSVLSKYAELAACGWLSSPMLSTVSRILSTCTSTGHSVSRMLKDTSDDIHPEINALWPDNRIFAAIMAQKIEWLAKKNGMANVALIVGADHCDIEKSIADTNANRIHLLVKYGKFISEAIEPESLYKIIVMRPLGTIGINSFRQSEEWEEPYLKDVVDNFVHGSGSPKIFPEYPGEGIKEYPTIG